MWKVPLLVRIVFVFFLLFIEFLCELYSIINMIIERSMLQMSFPIGGLLLKENEESLPTLRLLPISMATVSSYPFSMHSII